MNLSDHRWYRSIRGGYWAHRSAIGWHTVTRKQASIYRNHPLTQPRVVIEDHSANDGLLTLLVAVSLIVIACLWWFA